ncbi:MAG: PIN domain-containing protein [Tepidisphaeraceae bacterium]|jgi:predicted nucleic acid-binding protein
MAKPTVLYDACVLYPAPLRDLLMQLSTADLFRARWTERIHAEWMRSVLDNRPDLTRAQLERTRRLMDAHVLDCLVTGYENLIDGLVLPDPDDRHVLAAAIAAGASLIVTYNLHDFPRRILARHRIEAQHPDAFLSQLLEENGAAFCSAARRQRQSLKNPPKSVPEFLEILVRQQLPRTVANLRDFATAL